MSQAKSLTTSFIIFLSIQSLLQQRCFFEEAEFGLNLKNFDLDLPSSVLYKYLLNKNEIVVMMYYHEWSSRDMKALNIYKQVSTKFCGQVVFQMMNCKSKNNCPISSFTEVYPIINVYHRLSPEPIKYNGPFEGDYLQLFFQNFLNPVIYISSEKVFRKHITSKQFAVISYIPSSSRHLKTFSAISLQNLANYPNLHVNFGVVTSEILAMKLKLSPMRVYIYNQADGISSPVQSYNLNELNTSNSIKLLIQDNNEMLLKKYVNVGKKSNFLHSVLSNQSAALIAFTTSKDQLATIEKIAINYHKKQNCSNENDIQTCCSSTLSRDNSVCEACVPKHLTDQSIQLFSYIKEFTSSRVKKSYMLKHPIDYSYVVVDLNCNFQTSIIGLKHRINKTLSFASLDGNLHREISLAFGAKNNSAVVIVDTANENEYLLLDQFTEESISKHIFKFSIGQLYSTRTKRLNDVKDSNSQLFKTHIHSSFDFNLSVLNSANDIFIFYVAPWCSMCTIYNHYIADLRRVFSNSTNLRILTVTSEVNSCLEWSYYVDTFPTLILFPANKASESIVFPSTQFQPSLNKLMQFLLFYGSEATRQEIIDISCQGYGVEKSEKVAELCLKLSTKSK